MCWESHIGAVTATCEVGAATNRWLATGSDDKTVRLWDPHSGRSMWRLPLHREVLSMTGVGQLLVVGTETGVVTVSIRAWAPRRHDHPANGD